jgi:hypothetical protein
VSDSSPPESDRRRFARRLVCVATDVAADTVNKHTALIRDMSVSGAYLLTRVPVEVGESLDLAIHLPVKGEEQIKETTAKVVRLEPLPPDRADVWSCGFAVKFVDPLDELEEEIEALYAAMKDAGLDS